MVSWSLYSPRDGTRSGKRSRQSSPCRSCHLFGSGFHQPGKKFTPTSTSLSFQKTEGSLAAAAAPTNSAAINRACQLREGRQFWDDRICLFPDNLHQHPLSPASIELAVEALFPRAETELSLGDG